MINEDKDKIIMFNPATLDTCNSISCAVCKRQGDIVSAITLDRACETRRNYIINKFVRSFK